MASAKTTALLFVCLLTGLYSAAEIFFALQLGSLALLADGFHNTSDFASVYLGWYSERAKSRAKNTSKTYGYARAEYLGAFANICSLLSLSLYIILEAIPRFIYVDSSTKLQNSALSFLIIAGVGIGINLFCAALLAKVGVSGHAHSHSHGHSHGHSRERPHSHSHAHAHTAGSLNDEERAPILSAHKHDEHDDHDNDDDDDELEESVGRRDVNVFALVVHLGGDVLSSIVVLAVGLVFRYAPSGVWMDYIDPASSVIVVGIIVIGTVPLIRQTVDVLMQVS
jgi:cation diffusion facilitator family transporter